MQLRGRDIVCLSTHYWDERWFRKQEFMSRFTDANRVLYVEPSFSMARRPEDHLHDVATNRHLVPRLERRSEQLTLLKPPRGLPKWSDPRLERLTYLWYGRVIRAAMERLGLRDTIIWVYRPSFVHGLDEIPHRDLVFDLVDDLAAYVGEDYKYAAHIEACVRSLVRRSDLLVVTAATLADRYGDLARRIAHVPNGFAAESFSGEPGPSPLNVPPPILGFVGTLFAFLDFELLENVARQHWDKSLVLVGPVQADARHAVERLVRLPNVTHVGAQPQSSIPDYLAAFDVCLNVFRQSRVADSVNPLKIYEYLAAGKPVVSTPMEALQREPAADVIAFAASSEAFCREIEHCFSVEVQRDADRRRHVAAPYSWDHLFARLDAACAEALAR